MIGAPGPIQPPRPSIKAADLFAGGGGMTHGAKKGGADVIVAVNHDANAIRNHALNHPHVRHLQESVWAVDPHDAVDGDAIELLLASPDCRHFSVAKGAPTKDKGIRGLAWVVLRWAAKLRPRCIIVENVQEFRGWGPLKTRGSRIVTDKKGRTSRVRRVWKGREGETFARWVGQLEGLGYTVEHRVLSAADYGTPTTRRRLFVVARLDGRPRWPEPSHGPGRARPYRVAAEVIDWSIPLRSIFGRRTDLKPATMRRIAEGVRRYVLENPRPFLVNLTHGARLESIDEPVRTITGAHRGEKALVSPFLIDTRNGEREGQTPRTRSLGRPLGTVTAQGSQGALVAAFMAKHNGSGETWDAAIGSPLDEPVHTVTGRDTKALVGAHLLKLYGTSTAGAPLDIPMPTVTGGGGHIGLVAAFLCLYYGSGGQWQALSEPLRTIVSKARFGLVTVAIEGVDYVLADIGMRMLQPHELAAANGAADMVFVGTKEQRTARIGNMVCPPLIEALVRANFPPPEQLGLFGEAA